MPDCDRLAANNIEKQTPLVRSPGTQVVDPSADSDDDCECSQDDTDDYSQPCRFGRPCGVILTDITEEGLNQHLAQYHLQDLQDSVIN